MDDLFQRPLGPTSSNLNFPKKFLVKAEIQQLSTKKNWEVLMKIEGIHAISALHGLNQPPPPQFLGLVRSVIDREIKREKVQMNPTPPLILVPSPRLP